MRQFTFSVIIPTYNRGEYLALLLDSLRDQTFDDFEVIICDDGSQDETEMVVKDYAKILNITYLKLKNSGGPASPRNAGIGVATGKYLAFLDSDDNWYKDKLETVYFYLNKGGYDWVYHSLDIVNNGVITGLLEARSYNKANAQKSLLVHFNPIATSSMVIKTSLVRNVGFFNTDAEYHFVEDFDFWLRIAEVNTNSYAIKTSLGLYNDHEVNNSKSKEQIEKLGRLYDVYNAKIKSDEVVISKKYAQFSLSYNSGDKSLCFALAKEMFKISAFNVLTVKALLKSLMKI